MSEKRSFLSGVVETFLEGRMPVLLIIVSLVAGAMALVATPREEEPQIVVPLADVIVSYPGGSAEEVERLVASRLERLLYQIDGVEYVYSMSQPGTAVVTVRFHVGQDRENSLIKLHDRLQQNLDLVTPGIAGWIVKPIEIDDVPIVTAALYGKRYTTHELYRIAEEVCAKLQHIHDAARVTIHGGEARTISVYLEPERLSAYELSLPEVILALKASNAQDQSGSFEQGNETIFVETGLFLRNADEVRNLMVGIHDGRPVYLRDVATIEDGPEEATSLTRFATGPGHENSLTSTSGESWPAVTVAVAKKKGSNAVRVAADAERMLEQLRENIIPDDVTVHITRNYGATADEKVNNLVLNLAMAVITVIGLLAFTMSWREGLIVALAVPITYSLTLMTNYLMGYTINRVTLFALILALGLLVDDPIVSVENIDRHLGRKSASRFRTIVSAMNEVMPSLVLSTLAIIVSFLPMSFISGMMGPYMRPMAINVPVTVTMSTVVALTITPWLANKLLRRRDNNPAANEQKTAARSHSFYERLVGPFIDSRKRTWVLLSVTGALFVASVALALTGLVPLKMLPFDNKNEFQALVNMPENATLESTDAVVRDIEAYLQTVPEVADFTSTVGVSSPMDFNGMVRHYYLRKGPHVADVRINLIHRDRRAMDSHALVLRLRDDFAALANRHGAVINLIETPPGPPVLSTLVAEIYGGPEHSYQDLAAAAETVKVRMAEEPGVVDIDDTIESQRCKLVFEADRDKAARHAISTADIVQALRVALDGVDVGLVHEPTEKNELAIRLRLPRTARSDAGRLSTLPIKGRTGDTVQLGELGSFKEAHVDQTIHHKNQERVVYVTAEMAGRGPAYAVLALQKHFKRNPLPAGISAKWNGEGEWKITLDVFRDLGIAFGVALIGIYVLLVYETGSFALPLIIMTSIPLTMIGIMPGFWLLNLLGARTVGGFANPIFFTATAMIGMIALSGIVVRNAIVLIDFIRGAVAGGSTLRDAIIESGAVRMRPIFLTATTTFLGAWPITFDPIFSGLAWSLIFGLIVSTAFTLVIVPSVYHLIYSRQPEPTEPEVTAVNGQG